MLCLAGCGKLSRGKASDILDGAIGGSVTKITLVQDQIEKMKHVDAIASENMDPTGYCGGDPEHPCPFPAPEIDEHHLGVAFVLRKPIRVIDLTVTGISGADQQGEKVVDFTWRYDLSTLPPEVQEVLGPDRVYSGKAMMRQYDDGWRLVR